MGDKTPENSGQLTEHFQLLLLYRLFRQLSYGKYNEQIQRKQIQ